MTVTPNQLTMFRIVLAIIMPVVVLAGRSPVFFLAAILGFTVALVTDWYDGKLAREKNLISNFGKIADPIADKLLILGLFSACAALNAYSVWWLVFIFLRELVVTWARLVLLRKGKVVPAEQAGKLKVGFQAGSIYASFLFLMFQGSGFFIEPAFGFLNMLGIVLANGATLYSGAMFFFGIFEVKRARLAYAIATFGFIGKLPFAPGTWGSVMAVPIVWLAGSATVELIFILVILSAVGIWAGGRVARAFLDPDPGEVVIDEVCGMILALMFIPLNAWTVALCFLLFRIFDVVKPFGIRWLEKNLPGGWGIMMDDIAAGLITNLLVRGLICLWPALIA